MRIENGICTICSKENVETEHFNFYTIGSEGTWLCSNCKHDTTNYLRSMMQLSGRIRHEFLKERIKNK